MSEFKNILTDRLKAAWQPTWLCFIFSFPARPQHTAESEIFLIYPATSQAQIWRYLPSHLFNMERQHFIRPKRGAGSGISKSFWSLFYWWDLVGNNTRTMPQTSSAIFSILMKQKRNILGQTSRTASHRSPELIRDLMDALVPSILVQKIFSSHF